jgi:hypothetical protein
MNRQRGAESEDMSSGALLNTSCLRMIVYGTAQ